MLFVFFLWLIGDGGQWLFSTDVGEALALALGLGLIGFVFVGLLVLAPLQFVVELRADNRDRAGVYAWAAVLPLWIGTWLVPLPGAWGLVPFGLLVVCLWMVPVMLDARAARLQYEQRRRP